MNEVNLSDLSKQQLYELREKISDEIHKINAQLDNENFQRIIADFKPFYCLSNDAFRFVYSINEQLWCDCITVIKNKCMITNNSAHYDGLKQWFRISASDFDKEFQEVHDAITKPLEKHWTSL